MSVIYCRAEQVAHPFFIESLGVHIYSSQELSYAIYHHPLLAMDGFADQDMIDFVREELDMGFCALKMERQIKSGESEDEIMFTFLSECGYYSSNEINRFRQKIASYRKLPPLEYSKKKADYLFEYKQYGKAAEEYEKIIENASYSKSYDEKFLGQIWNNLGASYARIFQYDKAMDAYARSYELLKDNRILEKMYLLTKLDKSIMLPEQYGFQITDERRSAWDADLEKAGEDADSSDEYKQIEDMFSKDPIKRMDLASKKVEEWKKEYRRMA